MTTTNPTPGARVEATAGARPLLTAGPQPLLLPARCPARVALDTVVCADALDFLRGLPSESVNCVITSPPYFGLRDYGVAGQWGLEATPQEHVAKMVALFREVRRVLRDDGVLWVNYGDSYANDEKWGGSTGGKHVIDLHGDTGIGRRKKETGIASKNLIGMPWRVAFGLQDDGWILRSDVIWAKPNPMPESVTDRPTKSHEYVFLFSKSQRYWWDQEAVREAHSETNGWFRQRETGKGSSTRIGGMSHDAGVTLRNDADRILTNNYTGRNLRSVWTIPTEPTPFAHFATFPQRLVERCILAGCPPKVCASCGAPWVRDIDRVANYEKRQDRGQPNGSPPQVDSTGWRPATVTDRGFVPSCDCHGQTKPGLCLDPFIGSGTVGLVARRLGRHFIGSELNPEYVKLCNERLAVPFTLPLPLGI